MLLSRSLPVSPTLGCYDVANCKEYVGSMLDPIDESRGKQSKLHIFCKYLVQLHGCLTHMPHARLLVEILWIRMLGLEETKGMALEH